MACYKHTCQRNNLGNFPLDVLAFHWVNMGALGLAANVQCNAQVT